MLLLLAAFLGCESEDNHAPEVVFVHPTHGSEIAIGVPVNITVLAEDADELDASALLFEWSGLPELAVAPEHPDAAGVATFLVGSDVPWSSGLVVTVSDAEGASATAGVSVSFFEPPPELPPPPEEPVPPPDVDQDRWNAEEDCDDLNRYVHPGAHEVCNGIDDNCDGYIDEYVMTYWYVDADGDGYAGSSPAVASCEDLSATYFTYSYPQDCNDSDPTVNPGQPEICNDQEDDCSLYTLDWPFYWYIDADQDGYGSQSDVVVTCFDLSDTHALHPHFDDFDCDDLDPAIHPHALEVCRNGIDDDCDSGDAVCP